LGKLLGCKNAFYGIYVFAEIRRPLLPLESFIGEEFFDVGVGVIVGWGSLGLLQSFLIQIKNNGIHARGVG